MTERSIHRHRRGQYLLAAVGALAALAAIVLLALGTTAFVRTTDQVEVNSQFRTDLQASRRVASIANASSELAQCDRNNRQDRLLARLLGFSAEQRVRRGDPLSVREQSFLAELMGSLEGVNCHTLPTVALTEDRYGPVHAPAIEQEHPPRYVPNEGGH